MRVFLAVTNQPTISAFDCQALMREVNAFRRRASEGWESGPLEVLVTGRSAYVAEISLGMRHDIVVTLLGSILLVGAVFYVGFHRWLPLVGMGFSLLLCCLIAVATGLLIFAELNMVTIGMCAILIGLGVDFAILIFGRYQQARIEGSNHVAAIEEAIDRLGQAIFFGADMPPSFSIIDDAGVVLHKDATRTQRAMLAGLVQVVQRLDAAAPISYLTQREVEQAVSVEACKYRAHS